MRANLVLDLLNRIIENRIEIWDEITFNIEDSELDIVKEEFLSNHKRTSDREIISLIIKHTETVYKWIVNQLKIEYQKRVLYTSTFRHSSKKNKISIDFQYHSFDLDEQEILNDIIKRAEQLIDSNYTFSYNILYLLPFKNGKYFKFGISKDMDFSRVYHIDNLYEIDFENSVLYYGLKSDIHLVEKYIKKITPRIYNNPYNGKDGHSEVRDFSLFEQIYKKCEEQFSQDFSLIKYELKNLCLDNPKNVIKSRRNVKKDDSNSFTEIPELEYVPDMFSFPII